MTWGVVTRALRGALLLPCCAGGLAAQASPPSSTPPRQVYSARDAIGWSVESELDAMREQLAEAGASASREAATPTTRARALTTAREIARQRSTAAMRAYLDTTTADPQTLRMLAAYVAMHGGEGAMALLLAAEQRKPGDWTTQYNIAAFLLLEGYPRASLAILDSLRAPERVSGPGTIDLQAALLLGRGNALMASGRAQQAVPLLREARRLEPMMSEAARALARAHLILKEDAEAARVLRTGGRRFATRAAMQAAERVPPVTDPTITIDDDLITEVMRNRDEQTVPLADRWSLQKGQSQALLVLPPPTSIDDIERSTRRLDAYTQQLGAQMQEAMSRSVQAAQAYATDTREWGLPALRTRLHVDANLPWGIEPARIARCEDPEANMAEMSDDFDGRAANREADSLFAEERLEDEALAARTRALRRARVTMCERLELKFWTQTTLALYEQEGRCGTGPGAHRCRCTAQRATAASQLNAVKSASLPFLAAAGAWYSTAHQRATAVAAHVEPDDAVLRKVLEAELDVHRTMVAQGVHGFLQLQYGAIVEFCDPDDPAFAASDTGAMSDAELIESVIADACRAADGVGVKQDLVLVEVKVSCYELEVEGKVPLPFAPVVQGVGSVTYAFGGANAGDLTIFTGVGVGVDVGVAEVGAKVGEYITFNDGVKDAGYKASAEVSVGNTVKEVSGSLSVKEVAVAAAGTATYVSNSFLALTAP